MLLKHNVRQSCLLYKVGAVFSSFNFNCVNLFLSFVKVYALSCNFASLITMRNNEEEDTKIYFIYFIILPTFRNDVCNNDTAGEHVLVLTKIIKFYLLNVQISFSHRFYSVIINQTIFQFFGFKSERNM